MSMTDARSQQYPLIVAQFDLVGHHRRTEHWCLMVLVSARTYHTYEVRGNHDTFTYVHDVERSRAPCIASPSYRGGCHIGNIPATEAALERLDGQLKTVTVIKWDMEWDCQDWVIAGMRMLQEGDDEVVFAGMNARDVRKELAEDKERWEQGDDTVDERLCPALSGEET